MRWLKPLGFTPCPAALERALERSLGADRWPDELAGWRMLRFVIDRAPKLPPGQQCTILKAVTGPGFGPHARDAYAKGLAAHGLPTPPDWLEEFRRLFAAGRSPGNTVLLFPGAGHPLKQWPLVQFFLLAAALKERGLEPLFVLGPAELERGLVPESHAWTAPQSLDDLERLLLAARAVVGGDTGPMHLAGMLGVPGASLFGPTSFAQWGPVGMREASLGLSCSPCTATCADLACDGACDGPRCLTGITPAMVLEELEKALT
jgi:ADP-heptose:LPS heptosyltransferase